MDVKLPIIGEDNKKPADTAGADSGDKNPHLASIYEDVENREKWASKDRVVQKRRLADRPKKRAKPYSGAPNFVVPIIDDTVRDKTDQEVSMMLNSRLFAYFIPMDDRMTVMQTEEAQAAFDTYLRYIINITPKVEEADDAKNARGFTVVKVVRNKYDRFRYLFPSLPADEPVMLPDIEVRDPADVIVPFYARRDMTRSDRICDVYRFSMQEFDDLAKERKWKNVKTVRDNAGEAEKAEKTKGVLETTGHLIGITTAGKNSKQVLVYEFYFYADEWAVTQATKLYGADTHNVELGRRCMMTFSPDSPEAPLEIAPWREPVQLVPSDTPNVFREIQGPDRPWPFIQPRNENRTSYFYDSRGVGQLVMDDQIAASATRNAKHILMDYYQLPLFTGTHRNSPQMSFEPGSLLPDGVTRVDPVQIPANFDFTVEQFKREAGRRAGAVGTEMSASMSQTRKVQKTAREVDEESLRGDTISSAAVDRFVNPWGEVYSQLWEDLKRMGVPLPKVSNKQYKGRMDAAVYQFPVLIVSAASAKTLNPDLQFRRDVALFDFAAGKLAPMGVVIDAERAGRETLSHADPMKMDWIIDPSKAGPGQQQPVYMALGELKMALQQIGQQLAAISQGVKATAALAQEDAKRIDGIERTLGAGQQ